MNYKIVLKTNGEEFETLADILPNKSEFLHVLFIAKTPVPISVEIGHYFQGRQGKMFWNKLQDYDIFHVKDGTYEDENLLDHNFGITDIVKKSRQFGNEPTPNEYKEGLTRILKTIEIYCPEVIVFVYKAVLDNILRYGFEQYEKSCYGFNLNYETFFNSKVFVFPMPGTPCTREKAHASMSILYELLDN